MRIFREVDGGWLLWKNLSQEEMACIVPAAQVNLANGNRIQRPLQLLFPLEVQDTLSDHKETKSEDIKSTSDPADPQRPPQRKAAIEARQKFTC